MPGGGEARFACVPSDESLLSFDTVRVLPREPGATQETFQTVDPDELEEMLAVTFRKSIGIIKAVEQPRATCKEPWRDPSVTMMLCQIEAEAAAPAPDIKVTTTFVSALSSVGAKTFCGAVSSDARRLKIRKDASGAWDVYEKAPPGSAKKKVTGEAEAARSDAIKTAVAGYRAWEVFREVYNSNKKQHEVLRGRIRVPWGSLHVSTGVGFSGSFVSSQQVVVFDCAGTWEHLMLTAASNGERPLSPEVMATLVVRALRDDDDYKRICRAALAAPLAGSWAATHPQRAWNAAGDVPAVRVNVLLWSCGSGTFMRCIFLSTCRGAEWQVTKGLTLPRAKSRVARPLADQPGPSGSFEASSDRPAAAREPAAFVCRPSDEVCLSFTVARATPRDRGAKPTIETFLTLDAVDVEEAFRVACEQVEDIMGRVNRLHPQSVDVRVKTILVQVEAEALSLSRDFQVTATLVDDLGPATNIFCRIMSTPERRVFAEENADGQWRVYVARTVDGVESAPIDCTEEVERGRAFARRTATEGLAAARTADSCTDPRCGHVFCADVAANDVLVVPATDLKTRLPVTKLQVRGVWHKEHPGIINTLRQPLEPKMDGPAYLLPGGPAGQACLGARVFKHNDTFKRLCKDALMAPLGYGAAAARPKRAWNKRGQFPAIKVNVLLYTDPAGCPRDRVFLSLPERKEWRPKPPTAPLIAHVGRYLTMRDTVGGARGREVEPALTWDHFFAMCEGQGSV
ncbi:unnamed protein product [Pedinophyceae sp. YPF-701]|nr:unnamed protein product [Pedinophyceae sp. YPF-701]